VVKTRGLGHIRILADGVTREMIGRFIGHSETDSRTVDQELTRS